MVKYRCELCDEVMAISQRKMYVTAQNARSEQLFSIYIYATAYPTSRSVQNDEGLHGKLLVLKRAYHRKGTKGWQSAC